MLHPVELVLAGLLALAIAWTLRLVVARMQRNRHRALEERRSIALADERTAAALASPGTLPSDPIIVESAAVIEPRTQAEPCPVCGGHLHVQEHGASEVAGQRLRTVRLRCGSCGREVRMFVRIAAPGPN